VIGAVAFNVVKRFLKASFIEKDIDNTVHGYVKFNKLFIKTMDQEIKIFLYKEKQEILNKANLSLAKLGYNTHLIDIFFR
jgi:predicted glycosyltransferase